MPNIPPKPQLILAALDTDTSPLRWWLRVDTEWYVSAEITRNVLPEWVSAWRLRLPKLDYSVDGGCWRAARDIHAAQAALKMAESEG